VREPVEFSCVAQTIIASLGATIALGTLIKAMLEYRSQGRQQRAEYFLRMMERSFSDERPLEVCELLDAEDELRLGELPWPHRREFWVSSKRSRCLSAAG
jgi:hypothetical protein